MASKRIASLAGLAPRKRPTKQAKPRVSLSEPVEAREVECESLHPVLRPARALAGPLRQMHHRSVTTTRGASAGRSGGHSPGPTARRAAARAGNAGHPSSRPSRLAGEGSRLADEGRIQTARSSRWQRTASSSNPLRSITVPARDEGPVPLAGDATGRRTSKGLALAADAVTVPIEAVRVGRQHAKSPVGDIGTVEIWGWRSDTDVRIGGLAP